MEILFYEKSIASRRRKLQIKRMRKHIETWYDEINGDDSLDSVCVAYRYITLRGRRREMEDAVTVVPGFVSTDPIRYDYFAVYDGHGGSSVADACRDKLHLLVADEMKRRGPLDLVNWKEVITASFLKMDGEIGCNGFGDGEQSVCDQMVGSTAVVAIVGLESIVVANCGDSRAVISRGGVAIPLSTDHKPERPDEMERIEAAGGRVLYWDGYRVLGVLSTSRSIGDHYLKPYVISVPEVTVNDRTEGDEFLILASDGLWDVMSNEEACEVARRCLASQGARRITEAVNGSGASKAAAVLADFARTRGSSDNISIVVVQLSNLV